MGGKERRMGTTKEEDEDWEGEETQEVKEELSFLWHESLPDQSLWGRRRNFRCC